MVKVKVMLVLLFVVLLVIYGCNQALRPLPENNATDDTTSKATIYTEPSKNPAPTGTESTTGVTQKEPSETHSTGVLTCDPCDFFSFYSSLNVKYYEEYYGDVSNCKDGYFYAFNGQTGEIIELYDDTIFFYCESPYVSPLDYEQTPGKHEYHYVYYVTEQERNRIYRLNCTGTVKDELVYESPNSEFGEFGFSVSKGMNCREVLLVLEENQRVLEINVETGVSKTVFTHDEYILNIVGYYVDPLNEGYYIIFMDRDEYTYRYDLETGEVTSTGVT